MTKLEHLVVNIDGASRGNPGRAGIGIVIRDANGNVLKKYKEYIGMKTNNEAEYAALKKALGLAQAYGKKHVTIYSDSELIVRQRRREYRTRKKHLKTAAKEVEALEQIFGEVSYESIPREENREADMLANQAIDEFTG